MAKKERRMAGIQIRPRLVILLLLLLVILGLTATSQALARTWGNSPTPVVPWSSFLANASPFGFDAPQPIRLGETPLHTESPTQGLMPKSRSERFETARCWIPHLRLLSRGIGRQVE